MAQAKGNALGKLGKLTELRQRILFVVGALMVFRLGSFIPVPGVNPEAMTNLVNGNGLMDMFNMFSGGALERFSVFALGVIPYISASIVFQMMGSVVPSLQALRKEGEAGKRKMTAYTRYATVLLAAFQSFGIAVALQGQVAAGGAPVVYTPGFGFVFSSVVGLTAGTMFLMWLGEQMTERGIGNGISLLIFAGIVAGLPGAVVHTLGMANNGELSLIQLLMVVGLVLGVTAFVVFMERAQRRITVNYAQAFRWAEGLPEPEFQSAVEDQHVGRDPADLRLQPADVSGDRGELVQHRPPVALGAGSDAVAEPGQPVV